MYRGAGADSRKGSGRQRHAVSAMGPTSDDTKRSKHNVHMLRFLVAMIGLITQIVHR